MEQTQEPTEKRNKISDPFYLLLIVFALLLMVAGYILFYSEPTQEQCNSQIQNLTQANYTAGYYDGILYTQKSGKIAYLEQTINGLQLKELTLKKVCENGK